MAEQGPGNKPTRSVLVRFLAGIEWRIDPEFGGAQNWTGLGNVKFHPQNQQAMGIFDVKESNLDKNVGSLFSKAAKPLNGPAPVESETKPKKRPAEDLEDEDQTAEQDEQKEKEEEATPQTEAKNDADTNESSDEDTDEKESKSKKPRKEKKSTEASADTTQESEEEKAQKTVFVGNVPKEVVSETSKYNELKKLFSTRSDGKVKSIRFRSIAFSEILPRKIAFLAHKLHESRSSLNAYIVMDSVKTARRALELNGTLFHEHHLRVDSVAHPAKHDNKRCIFVGNLDFELDEEPLWRHFGTCGAIEYVRMIRDSKTNLGKGFAYVQFVDSVSVEKALLLHDKKLTGVTKASQARALRVTRARNTNKDSKSNAPLTAKKWRENKAKEGKRPRGQVSGKESTKLGRAQKTLGKSARAKLVEGMRATPGDVSALKTKKRKTK